MALSIRAKALLFHDPRSSQLLEQVERIARSDATALIVGETGTGKELIARHLHTQSGRKGPFIAVNCGAFSETLIDAELFGHETGAFTGATQARSGWFEAANGGTLFLDEIGDLSLALQVKLLRVLQERQVVRLGSRRAIALDVRLVAATNVDLPKAVLAERFRAGLFYRLSVATINLPPLCERPGQPGAGLAPAIRAPGSAGGRTDPGERSGPVRCHGENPRSHRVCPLPSESDANSQGAGHQPLLDLARICPPARCRRASTGASAWPGWHAWRTGTARRHPNC